MSAYTPDQVAEWLQVIGLPGSFRDPARKRDFNRLRSLHIHQLAAMPYENLSLHYNPEHAITLDPQALFDKMVRKRRGRGGYCMEIGILFCHMLRGLGYSVYNAGVRVRLRVDGVPTGDCVGFTHIVNIVTLEDGTSYCCDVAFGGDGPIEPLKLENGYTLQNIGSQQVRLVHGYMPEQTSRLPHQKLWIYQYRNSEERDWNSFYCFGEWEFHAGDFERLSWEVSQNPTSWQRHIVLCLKYRVHETDERIAAKIMLVHDVVKANYGGKTQVIAALRNEEERVRALEYHCGVSLSEEEIHGIQGYQSQLRK